MVGDCERAVDCNKFEGMDDNGSLMFVRVRGKGELAIEMPSYEEESGKVAMEIPTHFR